VYKVRGSRVLTVGIVGALVFAGVAAIAASLTITGVNPLGSGSKSVDSPDAKVSDVSYSLASGDATKVDKVTVQLQEASGVNWSTTTTFEVSINVKDGKKILTTAGPNTVSPTSGDLTDSKGTDTIATTFDITNQSAKAIDGVDVTVEQTA